MSRLNTLLESISLDGIDEKELFSCLQQMCRSEKIDRRVRFKLIEKLDQVIIPDFFIVEIRFICVDVP